MRLIKLALCLGLAAGAMTMVAHKASAGDVSSRGNTDATRTDETIRHEYRQKVLAKGAVIGGVSAPSDVKKSTDTSGAQPAEAPNDKVDTVPAESAPADVKVSTDDKAAQPAEAPNEKAAGQ